MNYTTNYHLPQWVAEDRILMEDFNEAMESIEAGLDTKFSENNRPYVSGTLTVPNPCTPGTPLVILAFEPHHVLIQSAGATLISQGENKICYIGTGSNASTYNVILSLRGSQIQFYSFGSNVSGKVTLTYVAYR